MRRPARARWHRRCGRGCPLGDCLVASFSPDQLPAPWSRVACRSRRSLRRSSRRWRGRTPRSSAWRFLEVAYVPSAGGDVGEDTRGCSVPMGDLNLPVVGGRSAAGPLVHRPPPRSPRRDERNPALRRPPSPSPSSAPTAAPTSTSGGPRCTFAASGTVFRRSGVQVFRSFGRSDLIT